MKKFIILVLLAVGGYFVYDSFIKEQLPYEINDSYNKQRESVDIENPSIQPRDFASYEGTIKNISEKPLTNISINYLIDAQPASAKIDKLEPGEEMKFKTSTVMLRHMDAEHHLKDVTFDEQ